MPHLEFTNINRLDDPTYWFETLIERFVDSKDVMVDAIKLDSHEYLLRFAAPDNEAIHNGFADQRPFGHSFRYVRQADGEFQRVESAHKVRFVRVSIEKGGGHPIRYAATRVIARENGYAVAAATAPFFAYDRRVKMERWHNPEPSKIVRLIESQLFSLLHAVSLNGGEEVVCRDIRKMTEVLHQLNITSRHYREDSECLTIDIDSKQVSRD